MASGPSQDDIAGFLDTFVASSDINELTMKKVKTALEEKLGAVAKTHYDKAWLTEKLTALIQAKQAATSTADGADAADAAAAEPAPEESAKPPEEAAAAAAADDAAAAPVEMYPVGTVLWAKLQGFPAWPSMIWPAQQSGGKKHKKNDKYLTAGGFHFVKFFGTNQYNYMPPTGLHPWESYHEKAVKDAKNANKKKPKQGKDFARAMEEAEAELASPTPLEVLMDGIGGAEEEEAEEAEEEEEGGGGG